MPELPEIENIVQVLQRLEGNRVEGVEILTPRILRTSPRFFSNALLKKRVLGIRRKGKYILFRFENSCHVVIHLGMTGQILLQSQGRQTGRSEGEIRCVFDPLKIPDRHTHLVMDFGNETLYYRDIRKFGFVDLVKMDRDRLRDYFGRIGYDPFEVDREFLVFLLKKRRARIKPLLLSQKPVAGLGNIYADETLFKAGIHPKHKTSGLSRGRLERFCDAMRLVLEEAIQKGGSSIDDYVHPDGSYGSFQHFHQVYGREGQPCPRCGVLIRKIKLGGRGTSYCPHCQR